MVSSVIIVPVIKFRGPVWRHGFITHISQRPGKLGSEVPSNVWNWFILPSSPFGHDIFRLAGPEEACTLALVPSHRARGVFTSSNSTRRTSIFVEDTSRFIHNDFFSSLGLKIYQLTMNSDQDVREKSKETHLLPSVYQPTDTWTYNTKHAIKVAIETTLTPSKRVEMFQVLNLLGPLEHSPRRVWTTRWRVRIHPGAYKMIFSD